MRVIEPGRQPRSVRQQELILDADRVLLIGHINRRHVARHERRGINVRVLKVQHAGRNIDGQVSLGPIGILVGHEAKQGFAGEYVDGTVWTDFDFSNSKLQIFEQALFRNNVRPVED